MTTKTDGPGGVPAVNAEALRHWRRDLHRIPEPGFREYKTKAYLLGHMARWSHCRIEEVAETGLCAYFPASGTTALPTAAVCDPTAAAAGGAIGFRSDMDGLPTEERNPVPYRSEHPGMMHACGHDGHMVMLLGLGYALEERAAAGALACAVLLVFQPAEEGPGGAARFLDAGVLERYDVRAMFAMHLGPSEVPGAVMTRPGPFMARSSEIDFLIRGKSTHISAAHKGIDALAIGCRLISRLYERETAILPPEEPRLLKFGRMAAGVVRNAIADRAALAGSLRCFSDSAFAALLTLLRDTAAELEAETGCTIELSYTEGYPPLINDPELFRIARQALAGADPACGPAAAGKTVAAGRPFIELRKPAMSSDDFSFFSRAVPSLCLFLGTGNKTPLHSDVFDFDEAVLAEGVAVYLELLDATVGSTLLSK